VRALRCAHVTIAGQPC